MSVFDARSIIERMKEVLGFKDDKDLRELFGVAQSTFSSWKNRNAIPFETVINFSLEHNLDLNWLILGINNFVQLEKDENLFLTVYRQLDQAQRASLILQMSGLGNGASSGVNQVANGNNNNQQVFNRDVVEVVGIKK